MSSNQRSVHIVGAGLIGGSVAKAFSDLGWYVSVSDTDDNVLAQVRDSGIALGEVNEPSYVFVCVPADAVVKVTEDLLSQREFQNAIITDVAGVKTAICTAISDPRFIGGHPMAGSEGSGFLASRNDLFDGCSWVLTPVASTPSENLAKLHGVLRELRANVVTLSPSDHDRLMATISHVPHILAATLMNRAAEVAQVDEILLQLAAGGFRDMTRIAASDPSIWPEVLLENKVEVTDTIRVIQEGLDRIRYALEGADRKMLDSFLTSASHARKMLPGRGFRANELAHIRVEIQDQPGELARVTSLASAALVNIYDIEISHVAERARGSLLLTIEAKNVSGFLGDLRAQGFRAVIE